jgi:hypothetical protein
MEPPVHYHPEKQKICSVSEQEAHLVVPYFRELAET